MNNANLCCNFQGVSQHTNTDNLPTIGVVYSRRTKINENFIFYIARMYDGKRNGHEKLSILNYISIKISSLRFILDKYENLRTKTNYFCRWRCAKTLTQYKTREIQNLSKNTIMWASGTNIMRVTTSTCEDQFFI